MEMIATIALWWCYLTGGGLALLFTAAVYIFALDKVFEALKLTAMIGQWRLDKMREKRGKILAVKS